MLGSNELMNSRLSGSEEALARLSCQRIRGRRAAQLLIGGLGMGFTLRAALAELEGDASSPSPNLCRQSWPGPRGPMAAIFGDSLDDPRVTIREADVGVLIRQAASRYDAILLDVDNGPEGLSRQENDALYDAAGLAAAHAALRDGGVLAVWSSAPDARFTRRLREAGFEADEVKIRANGTRGARHIIWIASARQILTKQG